IYPLHPPAQPAAQPGSQHDLLKIELQIELQIDPQVDPILELGAFVTDFGRPLGEVAATDELRLGLSLTTAVPLPRADDRVRAAVRDLLRKGGFKPTGRSKPASEYLLRAAGDGQLAAINAAVDACNVASLHSGLPISVVDLDRATPPLGVALPPPGAS